MKECHIDIIPIAQLPVQYMAWSEDGCFLTLLEDIYNEDVPVMVMKRVSKELNNFLSQRELQNNLQAQLGVVICDDAYETIQEILDDVNYARMLVAQSPSTEKRIFTRKELRELQDV